MSKPVENMDVGTGKLVVGDEGAVGTAGAGAEAAGVETAGAQAAGVETVDAQAAGAQAALSTADAGAEAAVSAAGTAAAPVPADAGKAADDKKQGMSGFGRAMRAIEPFTLVALPAIMLVYAWLHLPNAALVTSACAILALIPFFASFEAERRRARDIMPIIVMTALAVAGRLIFAPVPAVKPVTALIIITGLCFGRDEGFITGALTMLVSNIFFGQGPWTPWQMFTMGLIGYLAGVMGSHGLLKRRWSIAVFGFCMVFLYGFILDTWTVVGFVSDMNSSSVLATYAAGLFNNLAGAIGTVVFLVPIAISWPRMFGRIKSKYQIGPAA